MRAEPTDVLLFLEDPGAVNYAADLPGALRGLGVRCTTLARGAAPALLRARGVEFEEPSDDALAELLGRRPRALVCGTSEDPATLGLRLIDAARAHGVPTIGVVDGYANASARFRGATAEPLTSAPDWLAVPDEWTRAAFVELGMKAERVRACGHPQYDRVLEARDRLEREGRAALRSRLFPGAPADRPVVLFAAEVSTGLDAHQYRRSADYTLRGRGDSDERTVIVLEELLDQTSRLTPRPYFVLRLHPKNTLAEFDAVRDELDGVSSGGDPLEAVFAADWVVGMSTMLLVEAALLGRPTLSVLPRRAEADWLPTLRAGVTEVAFTRADLAAQLAEWGSGRTVARALAVEPGALRQVSALVLERLKETTS